MDAVMFLALVRALEHFKHEFRSPSPECFQDVSVATTNIQNQRKEEDDSCSSRSRFLYRSCRGAVEVPPQRRIGTPLG